MDNLQWKYRNKVVNKEKKFFLSYLILRNVRGRQEKKVKLK